MMGKNIIVFILSILLLVLFATIVSAQTCPIIRGDSNGNGIIELIDSLTVAQISTGSFPPPPTPTDEFCRMDANIDGRLTVLDSLYISQVFQGIRAPLGFCPTIYNCSIYDNDAPNLFIRHPFDTGKYNKTFLLINISAYDPNLDKVLYSIDGGVFQIYVSQFFFNFTIGNHTLTAFANDTYGNNVTQMVRFEVLRGRQTIP